MIAMPSWSVGKLFKGPALGVWAGAVLAISVANAQQAQQGASGNNELEEVVVTGSRIRRDTPIENISITEVGAEEIEVRGYVNPIESLEQLPFVEVGVNNRGNSTQYGDNNAYINLYGLGSNRTLTLVDGRRMVSSVQGTVFNTGNVTGSQVDVTIINPSLIKRAEVRTVGAGAVYGADAVAGVVNFILDREFTGFKVTTQYGVTDEADGRSTRVSAAWGSELFGGRGNVVLAGEYFDSDAIYLSADRPWALVGSGTNPLSQTTSDGIRDTVFFVNPISIQFPLGGRLDLRQTNAQSTTALFFPTACTSAKTTNATACNAFRTATGLFPWDFAVANPNLGGLNPLAFVGTFNISSAWPTVRTAAGSPEALLGLSRIARVLTFDAAGNPTPLALGDILPPNPAYTGTTLNSGGFDSLHLSTIQAAQERYTFNALFKFEVSPSIQYKGDVLYSRIDNIQDSDNFGSNNPAGSFTAGNAGVPIYYNQNPFVTAATKTEIASIIAANATNPFTTLGGQPVFYLQRSLADITGSLKGSVTNQEGNISTTFATGHTLSGDFSWLNRKFYWEGTLGYSQNKSENDAATDILDLEFALATDVVVGPNGQPVCRQKTLAAPESVNVRNPFLTNLNIVTGLIPTKAQIDACVPLNLFGVGQASQDAIKYVTTEPNSENKAEQRFASLQFGGELFPLPAGDILFNTEAQWRKESLTFTPGREFGLGLARTTIGQGSDGFSETTEVGAEVSIPIFGGESAPFLLRQLQLDGAVRYVERDGEGTPNGLSNPRVKTVSESATIRNIGGLWSPVEWIAFRGNKSTSVRSPSLVESLGAPQTGFSTLSAYFPCNAYFRDSGPASGIRVKNCDAFEARLGLPAGTFASLFPSSSSIPAGVAGSPSVLNETSDAWTAGFVLRPSFIEGLQIEADYVDIRIDKTIALTWLGGSCFDQPDFPASIIGGESACEALTLGVGTGPGGLTGPFTIPSTNIITGSPIAPPAIFGAPAVVQQPYTIATAKFSNVNSGSVWLQGVNSRISYQFGIADAMSAIGIEGANWGDLRLDAYLYYLVNYRTSSSGTFGVDTVRLRGRPGREKLQSRLDISHRLGKFSHQLQVFHTGRSTENTSLNPALVSDQSATFFRPAYIYSNYNVGYQVNDSITVRAVVNNVFNDLFLPEYGIPGDTIGRNYLLRVDAKF